MAPSPNTPSRKAGSEAVRIQNEVFRDLSLRWDLRLERAKTETEDSPSRAQKRASSIEQSSCQAIIKFLSYKDQVGLDGAVRTFNTQARILYSSWVHKPRADHDHLPSINPRIRVSLNDNERHEMLKVLETILEEAKAKLSPAKFSPVKQLPVVKAQPLKLTTNSFTSNASDTSPPLGNATRGIDDTAVPFPSLSRSSSSPKRPRETLSNERAFKIPRLPEQSASLVRNDSSDSTASRSSSKVRNEPRSAATSFTSNASSVFSRQASFSDERHYVTQSTQTTVDMDDEIPTVIKTQDEKTQSSEYWGSSFDPDDLSNEVPAPDDFDESGFGSRSLEELLQDDILKQLEDLEKSTEPVTETSPPGIVDAEPQLRQRLEGIFPELPPCLKRQPLCVIYEVTRVFLHADISMAGFQLPKDLRPEDYDALWKYLKNLPELRDKSFPQRSSKETWDCAYERGYRDSFRSIILSGSLRYAKDSHGPLFKLQLSPLKLDLSHRLSRRFGSDRFLEIDMPNLTPGTRGDSQAAKQVRQAGQDGRRIILDWLFEQRQTLFGRVWKPFYTKPKDSKERRAEARDASDDVEVLDHRVYFFATDGQGFVRGTGLSPPSEPVYRHSKMSVDALLNWLRPTEKNKHQPYLKLFSRTSLGLSRTYDTVIIDRSKIRYMRDIELNGEVMTDGAGRISPRLALMIAQKLKLPYPASGFQARFGQAKGFWSVNYQDQTSDEWIEVYDSQCKWDRDTTSEPDDDHEWNRNFEVLKPSGPLSSADLNCQLLPILVDRSASPSAMHGAIAQLLIDGLDQEMQNLQDAMNDTQVFRKWIRDEYPNIKHRLQTGVVQYKAGFPDKHEEKIMALLDAGFDPKHLSILNDLVTVSYKTKCDNLKEKMNITVGKSCYAYMVPDFSGVLAPDEVYLDFSSFTDESGMSGVLLNSVDVLVARSPAHYISDIQKVKAVCKVELMGLKDVIIFPAKGNPNLAAKLSGGDYDGDLAWVCWEPKIVTEFNNAELPRVPNLVEEGWITKNTTQYEQLTSGKIDPTTEFLKHSFDFNMQQSLLGSCTNFKEKLCAMQGRVDSQQAIDVSTLLSNLVDQAKQGYGFTNDDWTRFKKEKIKFPSVRTPAYKEGKLDPRSKHILDKLAIVAHDKIEATKTEFYQQFPSKYLADKDISKYYEALKRNAAEDADWKIMFNHLQKEIKPIRELWSYYMTKDSKDNGQDEDRKPNLGPALADCIPKFQNILPPTESPLTKALLPDCLRESELSEWALYRASTAYAMFNKSKFPWWMAGRELVHLKAKCRHGGTMASLAPQMYAMLKPDRRFVKLSRNDDNDAILWEASQRGEERCC